MSIVNASAERHAAVLASVTRAGGVLPAMLGEGCPTWQNYLGAHLDAARAVYGAVWPFCADVYGAPLLLLAGGGYGHSAADGCFDTDIPTADTGVLVFGWAQQDVEASVETAQVTCGLLVVRTVRISDDVVVDF